MRPKCFSRFSFTFKENINEKTLSPEEQKVLDDIINTLNEGEGWLEKVKSYAKKGLLTAGILAALLATPNLTSAQQSQIKQAASIEMVSQNSGDKGFEQIKSATASTSPKVIKFNSDGIANQSLNWGLHKDGKANLGLSISHEKGNNKITLIVTQSPDKKSQAQYDNIINTLQKLGLKDKYSS